MRFSRSYHLRLEKNPSKTFIMLYVRLVNKNLASLRSPCYYHAPSSSQSIATGVLEYWLIGIYYTFHVVPLQKAC